MKTFSKDSLQKLITARQNDVQLLLKQFGISAKATPEIIYDCFRVYGDKFMHEWFAMVFFTANDVQKLITARPRAVQLLLKKFGVTAKATPEVINNLYTKDGDKFLLELFRLIAFNRSKFSNDDDEDDVVPGTTVTAADEVAAGDESITKSSATSSTSWFDSILNPIASVASTASKVDSAYKTILGKTTSGKSSPGGKTSKVNTSTYLYIGIGVVVALIIIVIAVKSRK